MSVELEKYVNGVCTEEERNAVRAYIMEDFYNAFDVIEMMRDKAHDELAPLTMRKMVVSSCHDKLLSEDTDIFDTSAMPCIESAIYINTYNESEEPMSILDMLNNYLAKD